MNSERRRSKFVPVLALPLTFAPGSGGEPSGSAATGPDSHTHSKLAALRNSDSNFMSHRITSRLPREEEEEVEAEEEEEEATAAEEEDAPAAAVAEAGRPAA